MIGDILQPTHLLFVLVIALLVLGPKRLPEVGRSLGRGLRDFRSAVSGDDHEPLNAGPVETAAQPADSVVAPVPPAPGVTPTPEEQPSSESVPTAASTPAGAEAETAPEAAAAPSGERHVA